MAEMVYLLCAATSAACAVLLLRQYRQIRGVGRGGLLLWSSVCFSGLAVANAVLFVDLVLIPSIDLSLLRAAIGATATLSLIIGLSWEID